MEKSKKEQGQCHYPYWKEVYRVWYAYLLHAPAFQKYIEQAYHQRIPHDQLSDQAQVASGYDHNWVYPLLPDLWTRFPYLSDFERLWNRWNKFPVFSSFINPGTASNGLYRDGIDPNVIPTLAEAVGKLLPRLLTELLAGKTSQKEVTDYVVDVIFSAGLKGPVLEIANPKISPRRVIEKSIFDFLAQFDDIRIPPIGEIDPYATTVQFSSPVDYGSGRGIGDLEVLKRNLTLYVIFEENDFGKGISAYEYIFKGNFLPGDLVFGEINFTGSEYERILDRNFKENFRRPMIGRRDITVRQPGETMTIRNFGKWARDRVNEAKDTLTAVSQGWFPRIPQNSTD